MRVFVTLLLVPVAVFLLFRFRPAEGGEHAGVPPEMGGAERFRFLAAEDQAAEGVDLQQPAMPRVGGTSSAADPTLVAQSEERAYSAHNGAASATIDRSRFFETFEVPSLDIGDEARYAAALLHLPPAELVRFLNAERASLSADRAMLFLAFSHASAGEIDTARRLTEDLDEKAVGSEHEKALLLASLDLKAVAARPAASRIAEEPVALAMEMLLAAREARRCLSEARYREAAQLLSDILQLEIVAPWASDAKTLTIWSSALHDAQAWNRWNPRAEWPSDEAIVKSGDNLTIIRKRYLSAHPDELMCTGLIERANRLKGFLQPGQRLRIPTESVRVLIDVDARWLLYLHGDEVVASFRVGVGRQGEDTLTGDFVVGEKQEDPSWFRQGQAPVPFGDPRNPLGTRWIAWYRSGEKTGYGIHGTWEPATIGDAASDGCIRMRNEDVEMLYEILPQGAPIRVQP